MKDLHKAFVQKYVKRLEEEDNNYLSLIKWTIFLLLTTNKLANK